MGCRRIDLDELPLSHTPHADYVILKGNEAIIVEETGVAEIDDVKKLEKTIELVKNGEIIEYKDPPLIKAVLHARRSVPTQVAKAVRARSKPNAVFFIAKCNEELRRLVGCP